MHVPTGFNEIFFGVNEKKLLDVMNFGVTYVREN